MKGDDLIAELTRHGWTCKLLPNVSCEFQHTEFGTYKVSHSITELAVQRAYAMAKNGFKELQSLHAAEASLSDPLRAQVVALINTKEQAISEPTVKELIEQLDAAERKATPAPWAAWSIEATGSNQWASKAMIAGLPMLSVERSPAFTKDDAEFIAISRNAIRPLLELLNQIRQDVQKLHDRAFGSMEEAGAAESQFFHADEIVGWTDRLLRKLPELNK